MKTLYKSLCRHGSLEFNRSQEILSNISDKGILQMVKTFGLILNYDNNHMIGSDWKVEEYSENAIRILPGTAFIKDASNIPHIANLSISKIIETSSTNGSYWVVLRYKAINDELGTITIYSNTNTVTGIKTEFTKVLSTNRRIRLGDTFYTVDVVSSDTELTIVETFSQEEILDGTYKVGGWFIGAQPSTEIDNLIYEYDSFEILLKSGAVAQYEYVLAKVVITGSIINNIDDLRNKYVFTLRGQNKQLEFLANTAILLYTINQTSTVINVLPGQTDCFPETYTADFTTCFVLDSNGKPIGFEYTYKTNNTFEGVTFYNESGSFTCNSGASIFTKNSILIDNNGLRIGGQTIKYYNKQSSNSELGVLFNQEILEFQSAIKNKKGLLLLGQNTYSNSTGEGNFGALYYNEDGKKLTLIANGGSTGNALDGQMDIVFEVQNSASNYGNLTFIRNKMVIFQIFIPTTGDVSALAEIRFGNYVKINRSGQAFLQSLEAPTIYATTSLNTGIIDIEGRNELSIKKATDVLFTITIPTGGVPSTDTEIRFGNYVTIKRYGDFSCPIIRSSTRIYAADISTGTIQATSQIMTSTTGKLRINPEISAPATSTAEGYAGEIRLDSNYLYVCTALNTWKRVALNTW
jgi:hypothetical protein